MRRQRQRRGQRSTVYARVWLCFQPVQQRRDMRLRGGGWKLPGRLRLLRKRVVLAGGDVWRRRCAKRWSVQARQRLRLQPM
jgi:hypothetical protein